jgi:hypothetical protein
MQPLAPTAARARIDVNGLESAPLVQAHLSNVGLLNAGGVRSGMWRGVRIRVVGLAPVFAIVGSLALAGCGMSSLTSGLTGSVFGGSATTPAKSDVREGW